MPSKFIDFQELKKSVAIEDAVSVLGLALKQSAGQLRGACPVCKTGSDRSLVITPAKQAFYCFGSGQGGDVIALVAHVKACTMKEAADAFIRYGFRALPVTDENDTILGVVPYRDVMNLKHRILD